MSTSRTRKTSSDKTARKKKDRAAEIADTFEWLITAFILAFVFRAFVMEAFRIPTGSMANTLKGAHFRLRCRQCGYKYDYGFVPGNYGLEDDSIPAPGMDLGRWYPTRCPTCGYYQPTGGAMPVANGDRILVLKCIYQFFEPARWDVIVFKNPPEPTINYIKRLVGLPGEKVQIIDGDVYIDGQISRKPPKVQKELWMPVYDNDYQPVYPEESSFDGHTWQQPFRNTADSEWRLDKDSPTIFRLDSSADQVNTLVYNTSDSNDFRATYAYDEVDRYNRMPYCSDLMVRFDASSAAPQGRIGIALKKYQTDYRAWLDFAGEMVITKNEQGEKTVELARKSITLPVTSSPKATLVKFANVDHQLTFQFGREKLTHDLGRDLEDVGRIRADIPPQVKIFGSGKLILSHIAVFRDIHYITARFPNGMDQGRATQNNPFPLEKDEFFVLGDNSPNSEDGRLWTRPGSANKGLPPYPVGIVPRDYLVGKALFVYWPSGFRPFARSPVSLIPNIGQMRFIYGGSKKSQ